jgi:hypothetical protein
MYPSYRYTCFSWGLYKALLPLVVHASRTFEFVDLAINVIMVPVYD